MGKRWQLGTNPDWTELGTSISLIPNNLTAPATEELWCPGINQKRSRCQRDMIDWVKAFNRGVSWANPKGWAVRSNDNRIESSREDETASKDSLAKFHIVILYQWTSWKQRDWVQTFGFRGMLTRQSKSKRRHQDTQIWLHSSNKSKKNWHILYAMLQIALTTHQCKFFNELRDDWE